MCKGTAGEATLSLRPGQCYTVPLLVHGRATLDLELMNTKPSEASPHDPSSLASQVNPPELRSGRVHAGASGPVAAVARRRVETGSDAAVGAATSGRGVATQAMVSRERPPERPRRRDRGDEFKSGRAATRRRPPRPARPKTVETQAPLESGTTCGTPHAGATTFGARAAVGGSRAAVRGRHG